MSFLLPTDILSLVLNFHSREIEFDRPETTI